MIFLIIAGLICIADQALKIYIDQTKAYGQDSELAGGKLILTKQYNKGAFLNMGEKCGTVMTIIATLLFGGVVGYFLASLRKGISILLKGGLAFIVGGALSNMIDRLARGHVIDYLNFKALKKIVMNLADIFIFLGSLLLIIYHFIHKK